MRAQSSISRSLAAWLLVVTTMGVASGLALGGDAPFIRGDASGDGTLDLVDPITVLNYLIGNGDATCLDACDANDDGSVNVADGIVLLHLLFEPGFPPLPPPFPGCGVDPTPDDDIGCELFPACP